MAYNDLLANFAKGATSYPRSDGKNHASLSVLDQRCDKRVKEWIEQTPNFELKSDSDPDFIVISGDPFVLNYYLKLSTPGSLLSDYMKLGSIKSQRVDKKKDFNNHTIGLKAARVEERLKQVEVELDDSFTLESLVGIEANKIFLEKQRLTSIETSANNDLESKEKSTLEFDVDFGI